MFHAPVGAAAPVQSPALHDSESSRHHESLDLSQLSVLVVEHNPLMQCTLAQVLRVLGVRYLRVTGDIDTAFTGFCQYPADLVISDWAPGLDTLDLLWRIRMDPFSPDRFVTFIMVSAHTEIHQVTSARDRGISDFLAKPFTVPGLYGRIRAAVHRPTRFVNCTEYFGPDRRRRALPPAGAERRRTVPIEVHGAGF